MAYFWGILFHKQLLELWYSNPTSLLQLRPRHCCLDCSNDVGYFPVITLLIGLKIVLVLFFKELVFSDCTNNGLSAIACSLFFAIMGNCIKDKNNPVSKGKALGVKTFFSPTLGNCHSSSPYQGCVAVGSDSSCS